MMQLGCDTVKRSMSQDNGRQGIGHSMLQLVKHPVERIALCPPSE